MSVLSVSLADPDGGRAIVAAARWWQDALLGTVATTLAVLAVAGIGFLLLTGRLHIRRGASVLLGCFLLFGAPTIVAGLRRNDTTVAAVPLSPVTMASPAPQSLPTVPPPVPYDPYAGAAVPTNR